MGIESTPNKLIHFYCQGAFPKDQVRIYVAAAIALEIPYELIANEDERVNCALSFMQARDGEQIIKVDYKQRHSEFWEKVIELSPKSLQKTKLTALE